MANIQFYYCWTEDIFDVCLTKVHFIIEILQHIKHNPTQASNLFYNYLYERTFLIGLKCVVQINYETKSKCLSYWWVWLQKIDTFLIRTSHSTIPAPGPLSSRFIGKFWVGVFMWLLKIKWRFIALLTNEFTKSYRGTSDAPLPLPFPVCIMQPRDTSCCQVIRHKLFSFLQELKKIISKKLFYFLWLFQ